MSPRTSGPGPVRIIVFSASFGGPQRSAALAIREYYRSRYPEEVRVEVVDFFEEFAPGLNVLAKFAYQQPEPFFPTGYGTFPEICERLPANPVVHELRITGQARIAAYLEERDPHAVISLLPLAGGMIAELKTGYGFASATLMTGFRGDREWLHPATDLFFVPCVEVREDLVVQGIPWERVVVSGVPVSERFSGAGQPVEQIRRDLGVSNRFTVLLSHMSGGANDSAELAERLAGAGVQVVAVTGGNDRQKRRFGSVASRNALVKVFDHADDMHSMMLAADVLVAKAGSLTVFEALATGVPLLIPEPVPGHEVSNTDFLTTYGSCLYCRDEDDVVDKVRFLSTHPQRLSQLSSSAAALGKKSATQGICERVLAEARKSRA